MRSQAGTLPLATKLASLRRVMASWSRPVSVWVSGSGWRDVCAGGSRWDEDVPAAHQGGECTVFRPPAVVVESRLEPEELVARMKGVVRAVVEGVVRAERAEGLLCGL